jgi:hypothetical protein
MALRTLGTTGNNVLAGFVVGFNDTIAADLATLNLGIRGDPPGYNAWNVPPTTGLGVGVGAIRPRINQCYVKDGLLIIPNRGMLQLKAGDFVGFDATVGWPIVVSGDAAAQGGVWTHS